MSVSHRKLREFMEPAGNELSLELLREACGGDALIFGFAKLRDLPIEEAYRWATLVIGIEVAKSEILDWWRIRGL